MLFHPRSCTHLTEYHSAAAGIIEGAKDGKGRGRQVIAVARSCNLIFIVLDVLKPLNDLKILTNELEGFGIRLNKTAPNITVKKREKGGVAITNTVPLTNIDPDEIRAVLSEYKMSSASVAIHQPDATLEDLIDVVEGNRKYIPAVFVLNKIDAISIEELDLLYKVCAVRLQGRWYTRSSRSHRRFRCLCPSGELVVGAGHAAESDSGMTAPSSG